MRAMVGFIAAGLLAGCGQGAGNNGAAANGAAANADTPAGTAAGGAAAAMMQMQPGEWEISMTLPNGGQLLGTRVCLTPQDVARGAAAMMSGGGRQQRGINCDYSG